MKCGVCGEEAYKYLNTKSNWAELRVPEAYKICRNEYRVYIHENEIV